MTEKKPKKNKFEEELDRLEADVSKDWPDLDAQFEEDLRKAIEQDFPEEADRLLLHRSKPQTDLNK